MIPRTSEARLLERDRAARVDQVIVQICTYSLLDRRYRRVIIIPPFSPREKTVLSIGNKPWARRLDERGLVFGNNFAYIRAVMRAIKRQSAAPGLTADGSKRPTCEKRNE